MTAFFMAIIIGPENAGSKQIKHSASMYIFAEITGKIYS